MKITSTLRIAIAGSMLACACTPPDPPKPVSYVPAPVDIGLSADAGTDSISVAAPSPAVTAPAVAKVPVTLHDVVDGKFSAAYLGVVPSVAVPVTALPFEVLPRDQRQDAGEVEPGDFDLPRAGSPFSQLGVYREASGARHLALVEARPMPHVAEAGGAPFVWWYDAGKQAARALTPSSGKATMWRVWKGGAGHRAWNPDVLAVENAAGDVIAIRHLGAVFKVETIAVDPKIPMFVVSHLDSASGVDDSVTLEVVAFIDGELRNKLSVSAGPRSSLSATDVIGPLGAITATTKLGKPALQIRNVDPGVTCFPGTIVEPGCAGTTRVDTWDPGQESFVTGAATQVIFKQKKAGAPVTITNVVPAP